MRTALRILILGFGELGHALLSGCLESHVTVCGVMAWSRLPGRQGFAQEPNDKAFLAACRQHKIPLIPVPSVHHPDFLAFLDRARINLILIGSWGEIIRPETLAAIQGQRGIRLINCHPSLLPAHRGANPLSAVILANERQTGVTFHEIDTGIDTGPIWDQAAMGLSPVETGSTLRQKIARLVRQRVPFLLDNLSHPHALPTQQAPLAEAQARYDKLDPDLGWIRWTDAPEQIARRIRAATPWTWHWTQIGAMLIGSQTAFLAPLPKAQQTPAPAGSILFHTWTQLWWQTSDPETALVMPWPMVGPFPPRLAPLAFPLLIGRNPQRATVFVH